MQSESERLTDGEKLLKQLKEQWGHHRRYCQATAIPRGYTSPGSATHLRKPISEANKWSISSGCG